MVRNEGLAADRNRLGLESSAPKRSGFNSMWFPLRRLGDQGRGLLAQQALDTRAPDTFPADLQQYRHRQWRHRDKA